MISASPNQSENLYLFVFVRYYFAGLQKSDEKRRVIVSTQTSSELLYFVGQHRDVLRSPGLWLSMKSTLPPLNQTIYRGGSCSFSFQMTMQIVQQRHQEVTKRFI